MGKEKTREEYDQDFEDIVLDKIVEGEESRTRKIIKIGQTQKLNKGLTAQIIGSSAITVNEDNNIPESIH